MPDKTINTFFGSSPVFTSELIVQGHQRLNASIKIGQSFVADPTASTFSGIITLQRQLPGSDADANVWRDVNSWSIVASDGLDAAQENITANGEPETVKYRLGCKTTDFFAGGAFGRLGTS